MNTIKLTYARPPVEWIISREEPGYLTLAFYSSELPGTRDEQIEHSAFKMGHSQVANLVEIANAYLANPYETSYKMTEENHENEV